MKKSLLATTALVACGALAASPAGAEDPIELSVGGYYQQFTSFVDQDIDNSTADFHEVNVRQEGEIHFTGQTTLDNGLTVGVQVQLEAEQAGDQIDEHFIFLSGDWGRVNLGAENSAAYLMQYTAPGSGLGLNSPNFFLFTQVGLSTPTTFINGPSDANKITYFSPRFSGFQLGLSYTPNIDARGGTRQSYNLNSDDDEGDQADFVSIGANFVESFNGVDVAIAGGYEHGDSENNSQTTETAPFTIDTSDGSISGVSTTTAGVFDDREIWSVGVNFGFSGFTVGGSYLNDNNGLSGDNETDTWDAGIRYSTGPWGISVMYLRSEEEQGDGTDNELSSFELGASYGLGPGITAVGSVQYYDEDNASTNDTDGWGAAIGTKLSF